MSTRTETIISCDACGVALAGHFTSGSVFAVKTSTPPGEIFIRTMFEIRAGDRADLCGTCEEQIAAAIVNRLKRRQAPEKGTVLGLDPSRDFDPELDDDEALTGDRAELARKAATDGPA